MSEASLEVLVTEPPGLAVAVTETPAPRVDVTGPQAAGVVEVRVPGPAGPPGPPGATSGDRYYVHEQPVASDTWTAPHGLGKKPAITVEDSAGSVVVGRYSYPDLNTVVARFSAPFSGRMHLS